MLDGDSSLSPAAGHGAACPSSDRLPYTSQTSQHASQHFEAVEVVKKRREDTTRMSETHLSNFLGCWVMCWTQVFLGSKLFKGTLHLPSHLFKLRTFLHNYRGQFWDWSVARSVTNPWAIVPFFINIPGKGIWQGGGKVRPMEKEVMQHLYHFTSSLPFAMTPGKYDRNRREKKSSKGKKHCSSPQP